MSEAQTLPPIVTPAQITESARGWLGTPYIHQASARGAGADCLGLVRGVWRELYGSEPELAPAYTPDWNERRGDEALLDAAHRHFRVRKTLLEAGDFVPGDLLVFRVDPKGPAKHCGIAVGPQRFIHAYAGRAVLETWVSRWWTHRLAGVFIFPGVA